MPNAQGHLTNQDVRRICNLSEEGIAPSRIAAIVGVDVRTVHRLCPVVAMRARALRYTAFVERAARLRPALGLAQPLLTPLTARGPMPTASIASQIQSARRTRAARDVEGPIHRSVLSYLRASLPRGFVVQHSANRPRSMVQGGKEKALGAIKGWPDLAIYGPGPNGPSAWFAEVKAPNGRVSHEQHALHDRLMDAGFSVRIVRSVEDMRKALADWRLPSNDSLIVRREA